MDNQSQPEKVQYEELLETVKIALTYRDFGVLNEYLLKIGHNKIPHPVPSKEQGEEADAGFIKELQLMTSWIDKIGEDNSATTRGAAKIRIGGALKRMLDFPSQSKEQGEEEILAAAEKRYPIDETYKKDGIEKQKTQRAAFVQGVIWLQSPSKKQGEEKVLDEFGHHTIWKFCPGCGKEWDKEEGDDQFGCSSCGYTKPNHTSDKVAKEEEFEKWKEAWIILMDTKDKEIERLKGFINSKMYAIWKGYDTKLGFGKWKEEFKTENNL